MKGKAERGVLVPGAEVRYHGIQLIREQVTAASRTALVFGSLRTTGTLALESQADLRAGSASLPGAGCRAQPA